VRGLINVGSQEEEAGEVDEVGGFISPCEPEATGSVGVDVDTERSS